MEGSQGQLYGCTTCAVNPGPCPQKASMLGFMLCCLEILIIIFEQETPQVHFALSLEIM